MQRVEITCDRCGAILGPTDPGNATFGGARLATGGKPGYVTRATFFGRDENAPVKLHYCTLCRNALRLRLDEAVKEWLRIGKETRKETP